MAKKQKTTRLIIIDIDGVIVHDFDGHGLNQAAYADKMHSQPVNESIVKYLKWLLMLYQKDSKYQKTHPIVITDRKKSRSEAATVVHLKEFLDKNLLDSIHYYPEELGYEPMSVYYDFKSSTILSLIQKLKPNYVEIYDDDLGFLSVIQSNLNLNDFFQFDLYAVTKNRWIINLNYLIDASDSEGIWLRRKF